MSRAPLDYAAARAGQGDTATAQEVDSFEPQAGYYRTRLSKGGTKVGIRIWFGAPLDPITGDELDRSPRWQAQANGRPIDLERVWPWCGREPIDEAEYRYLIRLESWAQQHAPDSAFADPSRPVDLRTAPIPI